MEERSCSVALSSEAAKSAQVRLAKIIGQLKTVAKMLDESPRDIEALTQYASITAAVGSLMRLIAKDAVLTQIRKEVKDGSWLTLSRPARTALRARPSSSKTTLTSAA